MEHRIGGMRHAFGPDRAGGRAEQRQQLGGALAEVLVRLARRVPLRLPAGARVGNGLIRPRLILAQDRYPRRLRSAVRLLDEPLLCSAAGSVTVTTPVLRLRRAVPVGHHVRVRCQL